MLRRMMVAGLKNVTAPGAGPQTINIKLDTGQPVISGWNIWTQGNANNTGFLNTNGTSTGIKLVDLGGVFYDVQYNNSRNDADFPDAVINRLCYTDMGGSKSMKLTGLDNSSTYDLLFCSHASDADASDYTDFIVQGVTKFAAVDIAGVIFKTAFSKVAPSAGEITITIQGSPYNQKYGCVNGFILKENTN